MAQLSEQPDDDGLGAPGIEIAFELASQQVQPSALPPGQESEASAASTAQAEQQAKPKDSELETPLPESENADLNATQNPEKPEESEPEQNATRVKPAEESVAQEASAPTSIQTAAAAPKPTTVEQGIAQALQRVKVAWQKELIAHLGHYKRYPADRKGKSANIVVAIHLDRTGRVTGANVIKSSGDEAFDRAALSMVERASPVPQPPPSVADEGLDFMLPIKFKKNER
jgi:TonB family protein